MNQPARRLRQTGLMLLCLVLLFSGAAGWGARTVHAQDAVSKLVLSTNAVNLAVGSSKSLTATAVYESGATADVTVKTDWSSGDPAVASAYNGTVMAKAEGAAIVTATYSGKTVAVQVTVTKKVRSLTKNKSKVDLRIGEAEQIHLTATYSDNTTEIVDEKAEWSTDNDSVASVLNGAVTGLESGEANVTAEYGGLTVSVPVQVDIVRRLYLDSTEISLRTGGNAKLKLMALFEDGTLVDVADKAEWESDNEQVADALKGQVTAYGSGTAAITAHYGTKSASVNVEVEVAKLLTVSDSNVFLKEGDTRAVTVKATYADGTSEDVTDRVNWTSDRDSVAYAADGLIYGYSTGQAALTARYGSRTASVSVDVGVPRQLTSGTVSYQLRKGASQAVEITALYLDGTTEKITDKVEWSSEDESVAYAAKGKIYGLSAGTTVLTASFGGKSISFDVSVDTVRKLAVTPEAMTLRTEESKAFKLTVTYADGSTEDVTSLAQWSTDHKEIVSLDKGTVTGKAPGQATVTAVYGTESVSMSVGVSLVKRLELSETDLFLHKNGTGSVKLTAYYADGTSENVTSKAVWSSGNESVAYADHGSVTAAATGQTTITAAYGGKTASLIVDVAVARKLTVNPASLSLRKGASQQIALTAVYADGSTEDVGAAAEWTSSDSDSVYVKGGLVRAYQAGEAVITAKYGERTATVSVKVDTVKSLTPDVSKLVLQPGDTADVHLSAVYADGTESVDVTSLAEWFSKDAAVAKVEKGKVTAVSRGATTVTVNYGGRTVSIPVSVGELTKLAVSTKTVILQDGQFSQVQATATFKDGSVQDVTEDAEWTSSNAEVALAEDGLVTAVASGKATVTAAYGDYTATLSVEVELAKTLTVDKRKLVLKKDDSSQLVLTMVDQAGNTQDVTAKAVWTSSAPAVADVASGLVTTYAQGKATITAKYGGKTVTVAVESDSPSKLVLSQKSVLLKTGQSASITVTAYFSDGTSRDVTDDAEWSSSSVKAADVIGGTITGADTGKSTITAKFGGKSASLPVEVNKLKYLQTNTHRIVMKAGESKNVTLTATYADGSEAIVNVPAEWSSSKVSVADVKDGLITAEYKGTATIRAKYAGKTVSITVIVQ
ncbi:Ig-like domain-containing protein [Gorillibacterium sp. sgz5001074]|uniref:Ig-like domain-containing protein n=1 Tax=Gorillibacterium sp. sgz5001074 TaxID=3446695 RepID=UPI003F666C53